MAVLRDDTKDSGKKAEVTILREEDRHRDKEKNSQALPWSLTPQENLWAAFLCSSQESLI